LDAAHKGGQLFLIRVARNRTATDNRRILDSVRKKRRTRKVEATVPRYSRRNLKEREGVLQTRHGCFETKRPSIPDRNKALKGSAEVRVIHAKEENPPCGEEPIEWFLMASGPAETVGAASGRVFYYTQRRKTERFNYVPKSGCSVEKLQERGIIGTGVFRYSGRYYEHGIYRTDTPAGTLHGIFWERRMEGTVLCG
jgi:hypothetical protein